ncbi:hypothetical protein LIER_09873 [Lithospermum erythrorhizon]|uniref:Reverse transcriptase/retrotransposon-derived protein RNase H-like domain-containing protein n=1 Tax=Lithospermum erythrorhizon TaxID=34254 RepID=A0AAV3PHC9_LITER
MLVKSKRREDHLINLEYSLERLKKCKLRINLEKCLFGMFKSQLAALSCFISKSGDQNLPFFKKLRQASKEEFIWDSHCDAAFEEFMSPKWLTRPEGGEKLQLYLAVSEGAVSSVLLREDRGA